MTGVDIKATKNLRKSAWNKLIKQKINKNIQKRLWDEIGQKQNQGQLMGKGKRHITVQRRYCQGHHQNQAIHAGPDKEL